MVIGQFYGISNVGHNFCQLALLWNCCDLDLKCMQNYRRIYQPVHFCTLHFISSSLSPLQSLPPPLGGGLLQLRVCFWTPPPHDLLHLPEDLQSPQLPSTTKNVQYVNFLWTPEQWYSEQWLQAVTRLSSNDLFYITTWFSFFSNGQFFHLLLYLVLGMNSGLEASRQLWYHQILLLAAHQTAKYIVI